MHAPNSYDYALIRLVPSVERGECLNVGVILFCRTLGFLGARVHLNATRALAASVAPILSHCERGGTSHTPRSAPRAARSAGLRPRR